MRGFQQMLGPISEKRLYDYHQGWFGVPKVIRPLECEQIVDGCTMPVGTCFTVAL